MFSSLDNGQNVRTTVKQRADGGKILPHSLGLCVRSYRFKNGQREIGKTFPEKTNIYRTVQCIYSVQHRSIRAYFIFISEQKKKKIQTITAMEKKTQKQEEKNISLRALVGLDVVNDD